MRRTAPMKLGLCPKPRFEHCNSGGGAEGTHTGSAPMPRWMVEECSREFGQIPVLGLPFADPPTKDNMATKPSQIERTTLRADP